jgi:hypothetical protein
VRLYWMQGTNMPYPEIGRLIGCPRIQHWLDVRMKASWSLADDRIDEWWSVESFRRVVMHNGFPWPLVLN